MALPRREVRGRHWHTDCTCIWCIELREAYYDARRPPGTPRYTRISVDDVMLQRILIEGPQADANRVERWAAIDHYLDMKDRPPLAQIARYVGVCTKTVERRYTARRRAT